jgi:hypothetical protein
MVHRLNIDNLKTNYILTLVLFLVLPVTAFAEGYSGKAGAFLRMGAGAASIAGGEAGVARAIGIEQAHYNAAGLPYAPNNEITAGYHILSFDRNLSHVGVLYQVSSVSYWTVPFRPMILLEARGEEPAMLVVPGSKPGRTGTRLKINDYLYDFITEIVNNVNAGDIPAREEFTIVVNSTVVSAAVLYDAFTNLLELARSGNARTDEEVMELVYSNYRSVREKPAAVAVTWTHAGTGNIDGYNFDGLYYGDLGYFDNRFALSFGLKLSNQVALGVTAGVLYSSFTLPDDNPESISSNTFGADAGIQVRPFIESNMPYGLKSLSLGFAAYDLAAKNTWNTGEYWSQGTTKTDHFPRRYRAGFSYKPVVGVETYLDIETDFDGLIRPKGGFEYELLSGPAAFSYQGVRGAPGVSLANSPNYGLTLRAGMDRNKPSFGFGLLLKLFGLGATRLDYAYVIEDVSPEPTQVVSWRFRF